MDKTTSTTTASETDLPKRNLKTGRFEKSTAKHTAAAKPPVATAKAPTTAKPAVKTAKKP